MWLSMTFSYCHCLCCFIADSDAVHAAFANNSLKTGTHKHGGIAVRAPEQLITTDLLSLKNMGPNVEKYFWMSSNLLNKHAKLFD